MIVYNAWEYVGRWVCARTGGFWFPGAVAIGYSRDGRNLCAGVMYDLYNGASICMHVAGEGNWLTREFLRAAFEYPFETAKVRKVIGLVDASNTKARKFDEHLGFKLEATVKDAAPKGDLLIYSMTREQCRYLNRTVVRQTKATQRETNSAAQ